MRSKYKVGDKVYFGYYTGDDIVVEEYEVITVYKDKLELRNTTTGSLSGVHWSWLKDINHFDTYEEAYNHAINLARPKLTKNSADLKKEICRLKQEIAVSREKYGKED
jgi:hypothetical protein